jgi:hypothetical protein
MLVPAGFMVRSRTCAQPSHLLDSAASPADPRHDGCHPWLGLTAEEQRFCTTLRTAEIKNQPKCVLSIHSISLTA